MLAIGRPRGAIAAATIDEVEGAGHAFVIALGQTRAARDTELQRDLRALLAEFSRNVSSSFSLTGGLETFCAGANRLFGAGRTSVWVHDRRAHEMVLEASSDTAYLARGGRVSTGDPALPAAVALRRDRAEIPVRLPGGTSDGATGVVTVPLRGRRRALGTLVFEGVRVERSDEMDLLARADEVGRQLAAAIDNVRLLDGMLRSHRQLENTFNSIMDLVVVSDRRGRVVHVNRALAERLGRTHGELVDRPLEEVVGPDMARLAAGLGIEDRDDADRSVTGVTCEIEDPVLNGVFSVTVTRLLGESRESLGLVVIARDVTPHARLEAERADLQQPPRPVREARRAGAARRRHRARAQQPAAGRARPPRAAARDGRVPQGAAPRRAAHLPRGRPRRQDRAEPAGLCGLAPGDAAAPQRQRGAVAGPGAARAGLPRERASRWSGSSMKGCRACRAIRCCSSRRFSTS